MSFSCNFCEKTFSRKGNLNQHIRNIHHSEPLCDSGKLCPLCNNIVGYQVFREHFEAQHGKVIEKEELTFNCMREFLEWKENVENTLKASYTVTNSKTMANGEKKLYYSCHRSGHYLSQSTGQRLLKSQGTCKINAHCPSTIQAVDSGEKISVTFFKTHVGHDMDIKHLALSQTEKENLARKIADGVSLKRCLDDVRHSLNDQFERIHLLTCKDLRNIAKRENLLQQEQRHTSDSTSVELFVQEMSELNERSPVAYFKPQGTAADKLDDSDFILVIITPIQKEMLMKFGANKICIDSTHGTNAYDFNLTTLVVIDEFGVGFPAAFCISNHVNSSHMEIFFESIKKTTGSIATNFFMSDDAPAYYNAWGNIMGQPLKKLLCTWHVDKNWKQALFKIEGIEKRVAVYKFLRALLEETDAERFHCLLNTFCMELNDNEDTKAFGKYFQKYYVSRCTEWAYCFRLGAGINTNMYLEAFHKVLKHKYMEGRVNKRIDSCIGHILDVVRDKAFQRYIKLIKGSNSDKISMIHERHRKGMLIPEGNITEIDHRNWKVVSLQEARIQYEVGMASCELPKCEQKCNLCNVCIHGYTCSCIDSIVRGNMCKHIHRVHSLNCNADVPEPQVLSSGDSINEIVDSDGFKSLILSERKELGNASIEAKLRYALELVKKSSVNEKTEQVLNRHLDLIIDNLHDKSLQDPPSIKEPPNKKLCLQRRFFSTKKKTSASTSTSMSKPSSTFKLSLIDSINNSEGIMNADNYNDHCYSKCNE